MRSLAFACTALVRQPARSALGVLGIAAIGALLFDMLLLSRGLVVSFRDLLDTIGFDVRVMATDALPLTGPDLPDAARIVATLSALPDLESVVPVRLGAARVEPQGSTIALFGSGLEGRRPWTLREGDDLGGEAAPGLAGGATPETITVSGVANRPLAERLALSPGAVVSVRGTCGAEASAVPAVPVRIAGIADFPFETATQMTLAIDVRAFVRVCPTAAPDAADVILVAARPDVGADAAVAAIRRAWPGIHAFTNDELVSRFERRDFSYFRQISAVLASVTVFFGFLLITVLLTVSINQRFGEIAMLRAIGLSRGRVVLDVLMESVLLVGLGGLLALPLGFGLATWLDAILKTMPGLPSDVHFFVFEPRALALHAALLAATALGAALYPMSLVSRLPIAATLRREVVS